MKTEQHLSKARRIVARLAALDPTADAMAIIDGTMIAGYHLGNAALHAHGVTEPSTHYNTPSKFEVDPAALPAGVTPVYEAFARLEALRMRYVRSPNQPDAAVAAESMRVLERLAGLCERT